MDRPDARNEVQTLTLTPEARGGNGHEERGRTKRRGRKREREKGESATFEDPLNNSASSNVKEINTIYSYNLEEWSKERSLFCPY